MPFGTLRNIIQRSPPESEVRSSIQSTTWTPASTAVSFGACLPVSSPGRLGFGVRIFGRGGAGRRGMTLVAGEGRRREALRVEVLADSVERLGRIARREAPQLGIDRVARTDLDQAVLHAGVEAVERADRWTTGHHAAEVVDTAVTRADEPLGS